MKIVGLFNFELNKINKAKSRKIKLLICSLLLLTSFTLIGYRTITLASVKKDNISKIVYKNTQPRTLQENVRGNIYSRNNKILATTIDTLSLNINPQEILNKHQTIAKLLQIFPHLNEKVLLNKLNRNK